MKIIKSIDNSNIVFPDEVLLVYKDIGETSHDIINQIRKIKKTRKVGHAGVLDPFAEGLMLVGINNGTKEIWKYEDQTKEYEFEMILGIKTLSGDHQDKILSTSIINLPLQKDAILNVLKKFKGKYQQSVPILSNVKVEGKKLRELTRASKEIQFKDNHVKFIMDSSTKEIILPKREVEIYNISLINIHEISTQEILRYASEIFKETFIQNKLDSIVFNGIQIKVSVSKGTYIRVLNEDIANLFHTFGTLISLKRTRIGEFSL